MKWVVAAGFDFSNMAPAEMVLARHVEYLRADATLLALFGGSSLDGNMIRACPFGRAIEIAKTPALYASLPITDRQPAPGFNSEKITIRDSIRFHSEGVTNDEPIWEPGLLTVVSHLIGVVTGPGARQLNYTTVGSGVVGLVNRVNLQAVSTEQIQPLQNGEGVNLYEIRIDFEYDSAVNVSTTPRLWPLAVNGE